jgi:hypothetical protein
MRAEAVIPAAPAPMDERVDRLCVDAIRTLTMDAVERAKSGHPGMPMAMAPVAYLLYTRYLKPLLQAALCLAQPGRARFRNRPSFGGATLIQATLRIAQPAAPPLHRRQLRRQLIAAPVAKALVL